MTAGTGRFGGPHADGVRFRPGDPKDKALVCTPGNNGFRSACLFGAANISEAGTQLLICTPAGQNRDVARSTLDWVIGAIATLFVTSTARGHL